MAKPKKKAAPAKKSAPKKMPAKKVAAKSAKAKAKPAKAAKPDPVALYKQAEIAINANDFKRAVELIEEASAVASKKVRLQIQTMCQTRGNYFLWNQKWKQALAVYDAGVAVARSGDDTRITAEMLNESGFAHMQLHKLDEAEQRIRKSLELHGEAKRLEGEASAIYYLSSVVFERGDIAGAVELSRQAVAKSVEGKDQRGEAFHAYALARALYERGQTREAEQVAKKAVPLAAKMSLSAVEGNLVNMIANVALDDHRLDEAEQQYERAIVLFRQNNLKNHEAISISNIGNVMWDRGRHQEALERYEQAIKLHAKVKDDRSSAIGLTARAGVLTELGRLDEAQKDLEAALATMIRIGHERRVSFVRAGFARLAEERGELEEARAHYAETEMSLESAGDAVEVGRMLYAASGVEAELGDPEAAEALLVRAAALDPASLSPDSTGIGEKRAGMDAVRALRELALGRIEVARAKRASGGADEARALLAAARARLDKITQAEDTLVDRSSEVRRVAGRLAAQLGIDIKPPIRFQGTTKGIGTWKVEFTGDLFVNEGAELVVTGSLEWEKRRTQVSVRGPATGDKQYLTGTLTEVGGLNTVWKVRLELQRRDKVLIGRFIELPDDEPENDMCAFKWRAAR
jgi:tetratricopeptide (TPR) repeat protein